MKKKRELIAIASLYNVEFDEKVLNEWHSNFMIVKNDYVLDNYCLNEYNKYILEHEFLIQRGMIVNDNPMFRMADYALIYKVKLNHIYSDFDHTVNNLSAKIFKKFLYLQNCTFIYTNKNISLGLFCVLCNLNNKNSYKNYIYTYEYINTDINFLNLSMNSKIMMIENNNLEDDNCKKSLVPECRYYFSKFDETDLKNIFSNIRKYTKTVNSSKLNIALDFYIKSKKELNSYNKIIDLSILLESILCNNLSKNINITKTLTKIGNHICNYNKMNSSNDLFKIFYSLRSNIIHNGTLKGDKKDNTINKIKGFLNIDKKENISDDLLLFKFLYEFDKSIKEILKFYINELAKKENKNKSIKDINLEHFRDDIVENNSSKPLALLKSILIITSNFWKKCIYLIEKFNKR